ncbi:DUF2515 domain-containing protein [Paenibacillus sambharensis]|nr:DUF2515 domain-containing protein [Paenibacillus sambharensis]
MNEFNKRSSGQQEGSSWLDRLTGWPQAVGRYVLGKWKGLSASHTMTKAAEPLKLDRTAVKELAAAWKQLLLPGQAAPSVWLEAAAPLGTLTEEEAENGPAASLWYPPDLPGDAYDAIIHRIRGETQRHNRNNVTRTEAYRAVYSRCPELHWAMLAHMVSRNGGWNMTDLQGEWLPRLLGLDKREPTFQFLERANWLIFGDAYPQLLLYEASLRYGRDLSRLLPAFGVSRFMQPVWAQFWRRRDPVPLTISLIVNEQHVIEKRVVQHPYYQKKVLGTLFFGMQSLLQLNQVVFPYHLEPAAYLEKQDGRQRGSDLRLAGLVLESFGSLKERIEFGKRLYAMLFGIPEVREGVHQFARQVRHTGSRSDYAPHLFAPLRHGPPQRPYRERLSGLRLRPQAEALYSPRLADAWPDCSADPAEPGDWFAASSAVTPYFGELRMPLSFEMTNEYGFGLSKVEMAVLTAQEIGVARSRL